RSLLLASTPASSSSALPNRGVTLPVAWGSPSSTRSYRSSTDVATLSHVNRSSARRRAVSAKAEDSQGRLCSSSRRSAMATGSLGGTRKPLSPSLTVYLIPPTLLPITGSPHAIASRG